MTSKSITYSRHMTIIALAAFSFATIAPTMASADSRSQTLNVFSYSLADTNRAVVPNLELRSATRGSGDEIEDCMNNPDNAGSEFIERLGDCFCLATDNMSDGC